MNKENYTHVQPATLNTIRNMENWVLGGRKI